jgi:hypothetical protein
MKGWALNFLLICVSLVLPLAVGEVAARFYEKHIQPLEERSLWAFRAGRPLPYQSAPYYSQKFVAESKLQPGGWTTPPGTRLVLPNNFSGQWFHVRHNRRVTTYQPAEALHTVWMLGGSTLYSSEVPDEWTIASQLQKILEEAYPGRYRVVNLGASTVQSSQQLERLKSTPVTSGDIVIFYDGVNDAIQGVFSNNPFGWMVEENRRKTLGWRGLPLRIFVALRDRSALFRLLVNPFAKAPPPHIVDVTQRNILVERTTKQFLGNLLAAHEWTSRRGATFMHFLQSHLFSQPVLSSYESKISRNPNLVPPGTQTALETAYESFQSAFENVLFLHFDLTGILDGEPEHYLDNCHVTHEANVLIARSMMERLQAP